MDIKTHKTFRVERVITTISVVEVMADKLEDSYALARKHLEGRSPDEETVVFNSIEIHKPQIKEVTSDA